MRVRAAFGFLPLLLALVTGGADAAVRQPSFSSPRAYPVLGGDVRALAVGDLNRDGRPDLVYTSGRRIEVRLGQGGAGFGRPRRYGIPHISRTLGVVLADFTGDHRVDALVTVESDTVYLEGADPAFVVLLPGRRHGTFGPSHRLATPLANSLWGVRVADFNGDRRPDFAYIYESGAARFAPEYPVLRVGVNNGHGGFRYPRPVSPVLGPEYSFAGPLFVGDVNGDRRTDLVYSRPATSTNEAVDVRLGRPGGQFAAPRGYSLPAKPYVHDVSALVDVTGDHRADALGLGYGYDTGNTLALLRGTADGLAPPALQLLDVDHRGDFIVAPADYNGDCTIDFLLASTAGPQIHIDSRFRTLLNTGSGRFANGPQIRTNIPTEAVDAVATDLNHDGRPDLVVASEDGYLSNQARVTVLLNTTARTRSCQ